MCGRYSLTPTRASIVDEFAIGVVSDLDHFNISERYNIAPNQPVAVVVPTKDNQRMLTAMRWGLSPQWVNPNDKGMPSRHWFMARAETAASKPAFRGAYKYRRCIVPASGFYEWEEIEGSKVKQPWLIRSADDKTMGFAGLWETWCPPDGSELDTVTILTTEPNAMMAEIHDRMPVILDPDHWDEWMTADPAEAGNLQGLLTPAMDGTIYKTAVSTRVNSVRNDDAACMEPLG